MLTTLMCILLALVAAHAVLVFGREGGSWVIRKGHHYSTLSFLPVVLKHRKPGDITSVDFTLNKTMTYDLHSVDNLDWNKITGEGLVTEAGWGNLLETGKPFHQYHSWRLAWDYEPELKQVNLAIYYYVRGERKEMILHSTLATTKTQEFNLEIKYHEQSTEFKLYDKAPGIAHYRVIEENMTGLSYRLRPYFGGNQPAPQDCRVYYKFN